jgi:hypothetical protein
MVDEGRTVKPESIFTGHDFNAATVTEVFRDTRVTVRAVENSHFPERAKAKMPYRSFAYRFNTASRSYVFSGDTAYSSALVELAQAQITWCVKRRRPLPASSLPRMLQALAAPKRSTDTYWRLMFYGRCRTNGY